MTSALLASDLSPLDAAPCVSRNSNEQVLVVAELAKEYGFVDVGGQVPPSIRSLRFLIPTYVFPRALPKGVRLPSSIVPDWLIPLDIMRNGKPPE